MKNKFVIFLMAVLIVCISSVTFAATNPFSDVPADHWAYNAVTWLTMGLFRPMRMAPSWVIEVQPAMKWLLW